MSHRRTALNKKRLVVGPPAAGIRITLLFVLMLALGAVHGPVVPAARAQAPPTPQLEVGIEEKLGEYVPLGLGFVDADSDSVYLRDLVDRPTVLTLVYYHCPHICVPLLNGVADVVSETDLKPGEDYRLVTISFDPVDNPETARRIRTSIVKPLEQKLPPGSWRFLTGDSASIARITDATGFRVKRVDKDFAHGTALIVLSPDGKIVRYLYGLTYLPFDLKMAVIEAARGQVGPSVARVLRFCFSYDPQGRRYVFNLTRVLGSVIVLAAAVFVVSLVVLERRKRA
jgi:protein SCO1/2